MKESRLPLNIGVGIRFGLWIQLLIKNRFAVEPSRILSAIIITFISLINSIASLFEEAIYNKRIAETKLVDPPIFITGYWRSGTTHLHNLLSLDERFTFPTTYTCLFPSHFLLTERTVKNLLRGLLPETRPMDNMQLSWDAPQEDEIAMALLTGLSPYIDYAFPHTPQTHHRFLEFKYTSRKEKRIFKEAITRLVRKHTYRNNKRVVLKSPAHSYRIKLLSEIFPGAKFIHIYRDPITVFFSAVHTFSIQREFIGLSKPDNSRLEHKIIQDMLLYYRLIEDGRELLGPQRLHEIRFEDLEKQPVKMLERAYNELNLGGFESVRPKLEAYLASVANYKKNIYDVPDGKRRQLTKIFHPVLKTYGYASDLE